MHVSEMLDFLHPNINPKRLDKGKWELYTYIVRVFRERNILSIRALDMYKQTVLRTGRVGLLD